MKRFYIEVELLSPLQLGSGKADVILDSEAVHDKYGLPVFPGRRFKGLLYESALEMAEISGEAWFSKADADALFGHGEDDQAALRVDNLTLPGYEDLQEQWRELQRLYPAIFSKDALWQTYTDIRCQTSIDSESGTTVDGSLHNLRVVDAGIKFEGCLLLLRELPKAEEIITKALLNLRYAGAKRNRGCGHIRCRLLESRK